MQVSLIQRPTEVKTGRKTILLDGTQVGYFYGPDQPLILTRHVDGETAAFVAAEVGHLESCQIGKVANPAPTPPEWLEPEEEPEPSPIILP